MDWDRKVFSKRKQVGGGGINEGADDGNRMVEWMTERPQRNECMNQDTAWRAWNIGDRIVENNSPAASSSSSSSSSSAAFSTFPLYSCECTFDRPSPPGLMETLWPGDLWSLAAWPDSDEEATDLSPPPINPSNHPTNHPIIYPTVYPAIYSPIYPSTHLPT